MKEKILKITRELLNQIQSGESTYTFWINGKEKTPVYGLPFNEGSFFTIEEFLNEDIKNFNLTIQFKDDKNDDDSCSRCGDVNKWFRCEIIFWGDENKISYDIDFLSSLISIRYGEFKRRGNDEVKFDKLSFIIYDLLYLKQTLVNNNNIILDKFNNMKYD